MDARLPFYIGYIPDALSQVYHNGGGIARLSNDIPLHPGDFRATACGCHHRMDPRADMIGDDGALPGDLRIDQHGVHLPVKIRKDLHRERRIQPTNVGDRESCVSICVSCKSHGLVTSAGISWIRSWMYFVVSTTS